MLKVETKNLHRITTHIKGHIFISLIARQVQISCIITRASPEMFQKLYGIGMVYASPEMRSWQITSH